MRDLTMIAAVFGLEHVIKRHMDKTLSPDERREVCGGRVVFKKYYNTGAAGNFLSRAPRAMECLHAMTLGGVVTEYMRILLKEDASGLPNSLLRLGLALAIGGGGSNLCDRLRYGHVVDYMSFGFGPRRFRRLVFNLSDFCVFTGIFLIAVGLLAQMPQKWAK